MSKSGQVLGIDFGTTNTNAAWVDRKGKLHLVPVTDKSYVMPSVIWFKTRERFLVGSSALQQVIDHPKDTIYGFKRFLGRPFKSHFVSSHKDRFTFDLCEGDNGFTAVNVHGQQVSLKEITFRVIHRIVELANAASGEEFEDCVLTVPAHFGYSQRQALRASAEMAGLDVRAIVNEPTAAALYCAKRSGIEQTILVYDLGGGTFDISLVALRGALVLVLATGGDPFLGGIDFDTQIASRLVERFENEHKLDVQSNHVVMQRLIFAAESAKIELSRVEEATLRVPVIAVKGGEVLGFEHTLSRNTAEMMTSNLVERTLGACEEMLGRVGKRPEDVDELVFVGGQTRMLALQRRLAAAFRTDPGKNINPELGVAVGAAILGRGLDMPGGPDLVDVVSIPIGVLLPGGQTREVIPRNTGMPCLRRIELETRPPAGAPMVMGVYEALDPQSLDRELLGTLRIESEWLVAHSGKLVLELRLGQDFDLAAAVTEVGGDKLELKLELPKSSS